MLPELSLFILAYNEEKNIANCIRGAYEAAKSVTKRFEVIIVYYEGSADNTLKVVQDMMKKEKYKNLRIVYQKKKNRGYGAALKLGIENSRYKYIFYTDGDNQFDFNDIRRIEVFAKDYDIVTGYRKNRKDKVGRIVAAGVYNQLLRTVFGNTGLKDIDCAFKIYKKEIFDKIKIRCKTGMADAEIIIKAKKLGYKIKEVAVSHYSRHKGKSQFDSKLGLVKPKVIAGLLKDMRKVWHDTRK